MSWRKESNLAWLRELPGVRKSEPLATRTSFGIGGAAEYFAEMANPQSIEFALEGCRLRGIPHLLLGAGTNLLIADAGVEGLVIRVVNRDYEVEGTRIRAGAGLKMMRLARIAADAGLRGFEFAIGVPGTVRGSLVIDMTIKLERGDGEEARRLMAKLTSERNETQPIRTKNCGSVFMNPPGDSAGRLIQAAGLKGAREGNAVISQLHGNFIVNEGGATALDVAGLIERARATVMHRFGIELEREVELVGKWEG